MSRRFIFFIDCFQNNYGKRKELFPVAMVSPREKAANKNFTDLVSQA